MMIRVLTLGVLGVSLLCGPAIAKPKEKVLDVEKLVADRDQKTEATYKVNPNQGNGHKDNDGRGHDEHGNGNGFGHCKGNPGNHDDDPCPISP